MAPMMMSVHRAGGLPRGLAWLLLWAWACLSPWVSRIQAQPPEIRPIAGARLIASPPRMDGEVLEDSAYDGVEPLSTFWQVRPDEGEPASERTEVRIVYTREALYFAVVCYDRNPELIIVSDTRRDASLNNNTDSFQLVIDTYRDEQNGFVFGTNPAGIEYDAQVSNPGQGFGGGGGGRQRGGSGSGVNVNWDATWEVRSKVSSVGWSAEIAIPFRTLRYPSGSTQEWGVNFQRNIGRHRETSYWAPLDRQYNLFRLSEAGILRDLQVPESRTLKLIPYVLAESRRQGLEGAFTRHATDAGIDLKYGVTPSLTLDASFNTDFAQVEVDEQQINLDRFNLFFPEKRPFFLENAGLFSMGEPGLVELFFSRRIGLVDGQPIPILGGVRLSGRLQGTNVGLLNMQTESRGELQANNYSVATVRREFRNRSNVGAMVVERSGTGSLAPEGDRNRTVGIDGQLGIGELMELSGFVATTSSNGVDDDDHAFQVGATYNSQAWLWSLEYLEVGEGFNPEVGFLARTGYRRPSALLFHRLRPKRLLGFHELRPHINYRGFWDFQGFQETGFLHVDNHWEWRNGHEIHTGINFTLEGVKEPFEIAPNVFVAPGTYEHRETQLVFRTDRSDPLSLGLRATLGGFFGGDRVSLAPSLNFRLGDVLTSELSWNHNNINLPVGDFETNLARLRVSYSFSNRLFVQSLVQYNDLEDDVSVNLRLSWLNQANTGLFVVYNEIREFGHRALGVPDRSLVVKFNRIVDLFR